jgi:D-alanyl-lipoteichoic acid acyltransferase DltB (MBOAT superfamily)
MFSTALDYVCGLAMNQRRPPRAQAITLAVCMSLGGFLLCSPIDWAAIYSALLPREAFSGGWADPIREISIFRPEGSWFECIVALTSVVIECVIFFIGYRLTAKTQRTYFLAVSVITQLSLLGFFKYYDFFISGAEQLLVGMGLSEHHWQLGIIVPVGISFYTFHTMSYTIDVYRGKLEATDNLIDFALFVAFFPQMVAGPIARGTELLPQFQKFRQFDWAVAQSATYLIGWGIFKKIFIADNLSSLVNSAYAAGSEPTGPQILFATYAFAFQIYCDFSAYSDIARGVSRWMGIELMLNFNVPYIAKNPQEFWRRWHISLSTWLRDYLYVPLGGNRGSQFAFYRNLMITMILGGIWHGARANFLWWGIYQGGLLCIHRAAKPVLDAMTPTRGWSRKLWNIITWIVFFHLVCYGWLLFRAESNAQIISLSKSLWTGWNYVGASSGMLVRLIWFCWPLWCIQYFQIKSRNLLAPLCWPWPIRAASYCILFYLVILFGAFHVVEFIYFQF